MNNLTENMRLNYVATGDFSDLQREIKNLQALSKDIKPNTSAAKNLGSLIKDLEKVAKLADTEFFDVKDAKQFTNALEDMSKSATKYVNTVSKSKASDIVDSKDIKNINEFVNALESAQSKVERNLTNMQGRMAKALDSVNNKLTGAGYRPINASDTVDVLLGDPNKVESIINSRMSQWDSAIKKRMSKKDGRFEYDRGRLLNDADYQGRVVNLFSGKEQAQVQTMISALKEMDKVTKDINNSFLPLRNLTIPDVLKGEVKIDSWEAATSTIDALVVKVQELEKELAKRLDPSGIKEVGENANLIKRNFEGAIDEVNRFTESLNNIEQGVIQFFALENSLRLFKRAAREAFQTVKELDASLTEIAVVSDYDLEDLWGQRLQFSEDASKLGVSTLDLVDATKLFIQQGLDMAEAQKVATETVKMARIANLGGAEATDLMTASIRGFNMELTEAARVNDVYSKLAAITAADTREIAVAMSKTASIAHNAGASFENVSAFLSQIIETTREAPETAGTALKTVIARFNELKKPISEIGEVDGEIVDANRIETALRQAGIALRDTKGEFRDFDEIILELASKWDTLDVMTQRYIATQAAGSRQQSRFIALLSNNKRLLELTNAATNAAGAGQEQFNKTLESLESKLNKLTNQLKIFYTGLLNQKIIKVTIDGLTAILSIFNKLTESLTNSKSLFLNLAGSLLNLSLLGSAFVFGGSAAKRIVGSFFDAIKKEAQSAESQARGQALGEQLVDPVVEGATNGAAKQGKKIASGLTGFGDSGKLANIKKGATITLGLASAIDALGRAAGVNSPILDGITSSMSNIASGALMGAQFGLKGAAIGATIAGLGSLITLVTELGSRAEREVEKLKKQSSSAEQAINGINEQLSLLDNFSSSDKVSNRFSDLTYNSKEWHSELEKVNEELDKIREMFPDISTKWNDFLGAEVPDYDAIAEQMKKLEKGKQVLDRGKVATNEMAAVTSTDSAREKEIEDLKSKKRGINYGNSAKYLEKGETTEEGHSRLDSEIAKIQNSLGQIDVAKLLPVDLDSQLSNLLSGVLADGVANADTFKGFASDLYDNLESELSKNDLGGEQVAELLAKNGIELVETGSTDLEQWQNYMRQMGLEASESVDEMKEQFAVAMRGFLADDITQTVVDVANNSNIQELINDALSSGDTKAIEKEIFTTLGLEENADNLELVGNIAKNIVATIQHDLSSLNDDLKQWGLKEAFDKEFGKLLPTTQKIIGDVVLGFQKISPELGEVITNTLGKEIKGKTEEEILHLVDLFRGFESISSEEELKTFKKRLEDAGIAAPNEVFEVLKNKLNDVADATQKWSERLGLANDIINKAKEGEREGYTEEQKKEALDKGVAKEEDFLRGADGNYLYLGDTQAMARGLTSYYQSDFNDIYSQAQGRVNTLQQATDSGIAQQWDARSRGDSTLAHNAQYFGNKLLGMGYTPTEVGATSEHLASGNFNKEEVEQKISALMQEVINGGVEKAEEELNAVRQESGALMTDKSANELLSGVLPENEIQQLDLLRVAVSKITTESDAATAARKKFYEAVDAGNVTLAAAAVKELRSAELQEHIAENAEKAVPRIQDLIEEYTNLANAPEPDMAAMAANARELGQAFEELTGIQVGDTFFENAENIALFEQAINGSDAAMQDLVDAAYGAKESIFDLADQFNVSVGDIWAAISSLDGQQFNIDGTMDITDIIAKLAAAVGGTEKAVKIIEGFSGMEVKPITYDKYMTIKTPILDKDGMFTGEFETRKSLIQGVRYELKGVPNTTFNAGDFIGANSGGTGKTMSNARKTPAGGGGRKGGSGGSGKKGSGGKGSGGKGSSKSAEKETDPWVHAYDWLYNLVNKTNEAIRVKTKLERQYTKILQEQGTHLGTTLLNRDKIRDSLKEQLKLQQKLRSGRMTETNRLMQNNADLQKYARYDSKLGYVTIDWNAIDKASGKKGNNELGERIDNYVKELERLSGQLDDANDSLDDINDQLYELQQRGREDMSSLENRVIDALDKLFAKEIEKLDQLNQTISSSDQRVLAGLQEGISEFRQLREQDKAVKNISDQERRLALLKMDTSGANEMEIRALEKSIEEAREAHLDTLVDRNIEQMAKDAQLAQEQRQLQIDLMSMQLEQARENGTIAQLANKALTEAMSTNQQKILEAVKTGQSQIYKITDKVPTSLNQLLQASDLYKGMGTQTQKDWKDNLDKSITSGFEFWIDNNRLDGKGSNSAQMRKAMSGKTIEFTDKTGVKRKGQVQANGRVKVGKYLYAGVTQGSDGSYFQSGNAFIHEVMQKTSVAATASSSTSSSSKSGSSSGAKSTASDMDYKKVAATIWRNATPYQGGWGEGATRVNRLTEVFGATAAKKIQDYINSYVSKGTPNLMDNKLYPYNELANNYSYTPARSKFKKYKTGGLIDYTGMAWVDGSAQRPELVLNAKDTANFIELTKVLRQKMATSQGQQAANVYFNIQASVASDYDVDRLYKRLKEKMSSEMTRGTVNKVGF